MAVGMPYCYLVLREDTAGKKPEGTTVAAEDAQETEGAGSTIALFLEIALFFDRTLPWNRTFDVCTDHHDRIHHTYRCTVAGCPQFMQWVPC